MYTLEILGFQTIVKSFIGQPSAGLCSLSASDTQPTIEIERILQGIQVLLRRSQSNEDALLALLSLLYQWMQHSQVSIAGVILVFAAGICFCFLCQLCFIGV